MGTSSITEHFEMRSTVYNEHCGFIKNEKLLRDIGNAISSNNDMLSILGVGAGAGAVSSYLANLFNKRASIYALDISKEMLDKIADPSIIRIVGSVEHIPFDDNFFDFVVSRQCLHYIENID